MSHLLHKKIPIIEGYEYVKVKNEIVVLGEGKHGYVYKVKKDGKVMALKVLDLVKEDENEKKIEKELFDIIIILFL
jgi:predicted Ser/Thr protein kinase